MVHHAAPSPYYTSSSQVQAALCSLGFFFALDLFPLVTCWDTSQLLEPDPWNLKFRAPAFSNDLRPLYLVNLS